MKRPRAWDWSWAFQPPGACRAEAEALCADALFACLRVTRTDPKLPSLPEALAVRLTMSWDPRRRASRGGRYRRGYGLSIALRGCFPWGPPWNRAHLYREYPAIAGDPIIGSFHGDWRAHIRATIAHETAHVVQQWALRNADAQTARDWSTASLKKPHGVGWRRIYGHFRQAMQSPDAPSAPIP